MEEQHLMWREEYNTGIKDIDDQEKHFYEIANKIIDLVDDLALTKDKLLIALTELGNHAFYHFDFEEKLLEKLHYPHLAEHIGEHKKYAQEIKSFFDDVHKQENIKNIKKLAEKSAAFASDWILNHMLVVKKKTLSFFKMHSLDDVL